MNKEILTNQLDTPRKNKNTIKKCKWIIQNIHYNKLICAYDLSINLGLSVHCIYANLKRLNLYLDVTKTGTEKKRYYSLNKEGLELASFIARAQNEKIYNGRNGGIYG